MPIYEYECETCRHRFERLQHFSDEPVKVCPDCGAPVQRVTDNRQLPAKEAAKELPGGDGGEAKEKDKTTAGNKE
jgi:putative FmdB family regulatory protein